MAEVEPPTDKLKSLSTSDEVDTVINVSCWNILGEPACSAGDRQKVTTATFLHNFDGTILEQADIVCVQETKFRPTLPTARNYFPFAETYYCEESEEKQRVYNAVYVKTEKLQIATSRQIKQALDLLDLKRKVYIELARKENSEINDALKGTLSEWGESTDERTMCKEMLDEIKGKTREDIKNNAMKYKAQGEMDTKHPMLTRMAICCLTIKSLHKDIIVISIHNYSPKAHAISFARLFFEFLEKLHCPVIIAGDFNINIFSENIPEFEQSKYITKDYSLRPLRKEVSKIDFILIKKGARDDVKFSIDQMTAHDFKIPSDVHVVNEKDISNHNPISAKIFVKK